MREKSVFAISITTSVPVYIQGRVRGRRRRRYRRELSDDVILARNEEIENESETERA